MDQSFDMIRKYARSRRQHLTQVAVEIVDGTLSMDQLIAQQDLAQRWTTSAFEEFKGALAEAEDIVNEALAAVDEEEACALWRELLDEDFPTASTEDLGFQLGDTSHQERPEQRGWSRAIDRALNLRISASTQRGKRRRHARQLKSDSRPMLAGAKLRFYALGDVPTEAEIWWQVINTGGHARDQSGRRGCIFQGKHLDDRRTADPRENWEHTAYTGSHLIRALAVVDLAVVAETDWFTVNVMAVGHRFSL